MLVRAVRSCQRGPAVHRAVVAALALSLARTGLVAAQEPVSRPSTHTVKRGDTLWDIAKSYLGDAFLWPEIYRLNTDVVEDPHWIYPGEVLKLPGAQVVAAAPPAAVPADTARPQPIIPSTPAPVVDSTPRVQERPRPTVRWGEYIAAPWVDQRGGPRDWGTIIGTADLSPHMNAGERANFDPYDKVLFSPPPGAPNAPKARYLSYVLGPLIENFGQIVIPTGIIEVERASENGDAGIAHVVTVFNQISRRHRLIPYDTSILSVVGRPAPVTNGQSGKVRWMYRQPVLPDLQRYLVVDLSGREGMAPGDQIELLQPRLRGYDGQLGTPELSIGRAQVVRVTQFGATAILTNIERPKVEEGTTVRVSAKMP